MAREEWVRVESQDELRVGSYKIKPCDICFQAKVFFLTRLATIRDGVNKCPACRIRGYMSIGHDCTHPGQHPRALCLHKAIAEGRLYRLADLDEDDEETVDLGELELDELLVD